MPSKGYIDISRVLDRMLNGRLPTGVDRVVLAYIERWGAGCQALIQKGQWRRVLSAEASARLFDLLLHPTGDFKMRAWRYIGQAMLPPWPAQRADQGMAFHLGQTGIEKPGFRAWLQRTGQKPLFFIHDLIPLTHPEYCRPNEDRVHATRVRLALESGAGLVFNSEDTLCSLQAWAQRAGLLMPPSVVAPLAPARLPAATGHPSPLSAPYFVMLGTIEPRKNHLLLLDVWRELVLTQGDAAPHLVVIGQRGWECENAVDMLERCPALQSHVHEISRCSDTELVNYLSHARALLFPSFAEGFGMPMVEALTLGTPVIAADLPVYREFAQGIPDVLSPLDGLGWMNAVLEYARADSPARQAQLLRLRGYTGPTWDAHFDAVESFLGRLKS